LALARVTKDVASAFDEVLSRAGGSLPIWQILQSLKSNPTANQRELADAVGIQGATLSHHLRGMEDAGLVSRRRDPTNRRTHIVALTEQGEAMFGQLVAVAAGFDKQLQDGLDRKDLETFTRVLEQLARNIRPDRSDNGA
jgi:MarR family transcriptional regulator for hemolysin